MKFISCLLHSTLFYSWWVRVSGFSATTRSAPVQKHHEPVPPPYKLKALRNRKAFHTVTKEVDRVIESHANNPAALSIATTCRDLLLHHQQRLPNSNPDRMVRFLKDAMTLSPPTSVKNIVIQAVALSGMVDLACEWVKSTLLQQQVEPTVPTQVALAEALRTSGQANAMAELIQSFSQLNMEPSLWLMNIYFALRCEQGEVSELVEEYVVQHHPTSSTSWAVAPDKVTYDTMLHAAAGKNQTCFDIIWQDMTGNSDVTPSIFSYNACLKAAGSDSTEVLRIWDQEIIGRSLQPDRFTLDFLLLPMLTHDREDEFTALLDDFVARSNERVASSTLSALMVTLVSHDHVDEAFSLWKSYVQERKLVPPQTRQYNILLECYKEGRTTGDGVVERAWKLYDELAHSLRVRPDAFSLSIMCYMCRNSTELSTLLYTNLEIQQVRCNEAVLRTAGEYVDD